MAWAELTDARLYYEVAGRGESVLLIPGLGATGRFWDPIAEGLAEHFSVVMPDNRGIGRSVAIRTPHSLKDYSSDLIELLDLLQIDRTHVVGISFGGVLAQRFAVDHADRVNRLVLMSCAHRYGPYLNQVAQILGQALRRFPFETFLSTMGVLGTAPEYFDANKGEAKGASDAVVTRKAVIQQLRCLATASIDARDYNITAPTLVVSGEYDALIPNCYARQMSEAIPGSRFVILRGCGHNPVMERPDLVLPLLTEFLSGDEFATASGSEFAARVG